MNGKTYIIREESELDGLCKEVLDFAGEEKIWVFSGEMGAGKTTFIRHICDFLKVKDAVSSPTFSIVNEYLMQSGEKIYHFDFYRIEKPAEAVDIGCEEYFFSGSLCFIEWAEKILNLLPRPYVKISLENVGDNRRITFTHER